MNIREISDVFKDTADEITAIKSYNFGWASDRVRQGNTEDFQELNEFPRVFFAVPTITGSDQTRKQDTYQVTLFFDDLLGYDNEGDEDPTLQIDKWANLQQYANYFIQRLNKIKQSILPNYLFIPEDPSITFDSFTGIQRMITVQLSFNLVVPTNCDPGVITLVQCIANIVTSSNLTASLKSIIKFAASLEGRATVTADIALVQKVASSLNAFGTLTGDINFVQNMQAALLTSSSVTGNITIPKLVQASLTGTGTTAADLTVGGAFDADAQAFINAAVITDITQKNAINTLVIDLKNYGIWTKMKAIYPIVGGTVSTHKWNLKDPRDLDVAFRLVFATGWTHSLTGMTPSSTYADTFFNLNSSSNLNSHSLSFYSRTNATNLAVEIGVGNNLTGIYNILELRTSNTTYFAINSNSNSYIDSDSRAFYLENRQASNDLDLWKKGVKVVNGTTPSISLLNYTIFIGAMNHVGSPLYFSTKECCFASIGDALTDTEAANFYTAVQAFQTTLNRAV